jgi:hypothetical protein
MEVYSPLDANSRVVIDQLKISPPFIDPKTKRKSFRRIIPGLNVVVPWPKRVVEFKETRKDRLEKAKNPIRYPDTPTPLVARRTFTNPTLAYPPLPAGLELELHNPYSRFKRQKFARAIEQMAEWRRRYEPGVKESEILQKEIQKKDQNIYTPEQLRVRAANKLVKRARKMYFKRNGLTDAETILIAEHVKRRIEFKMKTLIGLERTITPITPLEVRMTPRQRLAHRQRLEVLEKAAAEERKAKAAIMAKQKKNVVREDRGRYKKFEITKSVRPPVRKTVRKKKRMATVPR